MQVQIASTGAEAVSEDASSWALSGRGRQGGGGRVEVQTRLVEEEDDAMELFKINRSLIWGCFQRSVANHNFVSVGVPATMIYFTQYLCQRLCRIVKM